MVVLLFDQKSEFQHELSAADRETTISDFCVALRRIFTTRDCKKAENIAPSTVHRELRRNNNLCGSYDPQKAQERTLKRRSKPKPKRVCENTRNAVELMLKMDWSPEQISAIFTRIGYPVSHEWIYNFVLADFYGGGGLFTHLRHRLRRYKKRLHKQRGHILGRRSIHVRPAIIDDRERYGDWEIDTVIGKRGTGATVTLLERQYVPKGTDLRTITNELMAKYQQRLNLRPRKTLGFIQPDIIFKEQLQQAMSECCSY